jgi:predicted nucleotidyltransferase
MSKLSKLNSNRPPPPFDGEAIAKSLIEKLRQQVTVVEVYLFGSCVTQENDSDSDIDLLVVVETLSEVKAVHKAVQTGFFSPVAVDWIVKPRADFELQKEKGGVSFIAFHHGKKLYP